MKLGRIAAATATAGLMGLAACSLPSSFTPAQNTPPPVTNTSPSAPAPAPSTTTPVAPTPAPSTPDIGNSQTPAAPSQPTTGSPPSTTGGSCHSDGTLPDPHCTPGAIDPAVTQASIASTICRTGWTRTVRPSESYTESLKIKQIAVYGYSDTRPSSYEEDHLIPLELGGSPTDPANLWPEPGASPNPKDHVENTLKDAVCSGQVTLAAAQQAIAKDWTTAERALSLSGGSTGVGGGGTHTHVGG